MDTEDSSQVLNPMLRPCCDDSIHHKGNLKTNYTYDFWYYYTHFSLCATLKTVYVDAVNPNGTPVPPPSTMEP